LNPGSWWAVALTEDLQGHKPLGVVCAGQAIALFRDTQGTPYALEDRCPHRRVPLSLGAVTPAGLQCPYHGWTFDGASGRCSAIPNLSADEPVPASYGVAHYPVLESHGFVHVWHGDDEPASTCPSNDYAPQGREFTGSVTVNIAFHEYLAAMLDGPDCLVQTPGVQVTDFYLGDWRREDGRLIVDRAASWAGERLAPEFQTELPLIVRTSVPLQGGTMRLDLLSADERLLASLHLAAIAHKRGTTRLSWRGYAADGATDHAPWGWRLQRLRGRSPFEVRRQVDADTLANLLVTPSHELARLRPAPLSA
jgi:phenylpropionate dioxygenase-like ring-hydroxylating dioxygenase large terminal subunit